MKHWKLVLSLVAALTVIPAMAAFGWSTQQSAFAACVDGQVIITVAFNNTDKKAMDVVATDEQTGLSVGLGTVPAGDSASDTIHTGLSSVGDGKVSFLLAWSDGKKGTDTVYAKYTGVECEEPEPVETSVSISGECRLVDGQPQGFIDATVGVGALLSIDGDLFGEGVYDDLTVPAPSVVPWVAEAGEGFVLVGETSGEVVIDDCTEEPPVTTTMPEPEEPTTTMPEPEEPTTTVAPEAPSTTAAPTAPSTTGPAPTSAPEGAGVALAQLMAIGGGVGGVATVGGVIALVRRRRNS